MEVDVLVLLFFEAVAESTGHKIWGSHTIFFFVFFFVCCRSKFSHSCRSRIDLLTALAITFTLTCPRHSLGHVFFFPCCVLHCVLHIFIYLKSGYPSNPSFSSSKQKRTREAEEEESPRRERGRERKKERRGKKKHQKCYFISQSSPNRGGSRGREI